jgi:hypothetical protein
VEVRRINNKLLLLESKYDKVAQKMNRADEAHETFVPGKSHFQDSALGRYLSLLLYRADHQWDDVRIDLDKISRGWRLQPDIYTFPKPNFSAETQRIAAPRARLNVIAFTGLSPDKQARTFYIHTEENVIILAGTAENYLGRQNLSGLSVIPWDGISEGYHFKFQLPQLIKRPSKVARVEVIVTGQPPQKLQRIESLEAVAIETFSIKKPLIFLKTVTRAVIKGLAAEQAKIKMTQKMDGGVAFLTRLAADLLVDSTENADLRGSRFFPAEAVIREIHLDEGTYTVKINYYGKGNRLLRTDEKTNINVKINRLNVLESAYLN